MISTADITTKEGCEELLKTANELGPVEAIFNLAVVLKDSILENQTSDSFRDSYRPKALATKYLDEISRRLCPKLKDFVVFSSVSCGRGNAGQTNYGHSNSVMERICEKRKSEGLPALAIQWGAIGEVGLVADMQEENTEIEIGGTLQQRISSCLQVMDKLLRCPEPIVSSMVVAEKRAGAGGADNIIDAVAYILGNSINSLHLFLANLLLICRNQGHEGRELPRLLSRAGNGLDDCCGDQADTGEGVRRLPHGPGHSEHDAEQAARNPGREVPKRGPRTHGRKDRG